jgi:hypothetical protein
MSLSRFGDEARKHPKMVKAGNDAAAFWRWAVEYSHEVGSDGFVDESVLHTVPPVPISKARAKKLAETLVEAWVRPGGKGLFERVEGGYMIHDFGEIKPSRSRGPVDPELSEKRRDAALKGLANRWGKSSQEDDTFATADSKTDSKPTEDLSDPSCKASRTRVDARGALALDQISEANRDPNATSDRATPEAKRVAPTDGSARTHESPYDLARRLWAKFWSEKYGTRFTWSPTLGDAQHRKAQDLGDMAVAAAGADAERWLSHKIRCYLDDPGDRKLDLGARQHPFPLFVARVNEYPDPLPKTPTEGPSSPQDEPAPLADLPRNPEAAKRAAELLASLPGQNIETESPTAREHRELMLRRKASSKAGLEAAMPSKGGA